MGHNQPHSQEIQRHRQRGSKTDMWTSSISPRNGNSLIPVCGGPQSAMFEQALSINAGLTENSNIETVSTIWLKSGGKSCCDSRIKDFCT
jgi:hypothetical protein